MLKILGFALDGGTGCDIFVVEESVGWIAEFFGGEGNEKRASNSSDEVSLDRSGVRTIRTGLLFVDTEDLIGLEISGK